MMANAHATKTPVRGANASNRSIVSSSATIKSFDRRPARRPRQRGPHGALLALLSVSLGESAGGEHPVILRGTGLAHPPVGGATRGIERSFTPLAEGYSVKPTTSIGEAGPAAHAYSVLSRLS